MPKKTKAEKIEEKVKKKLSPREWRALRQKIAVKDHLGAFQREFRKHMATFITGAFSFVAALLWRDAIKGSLDSLKLFMPDVGMWVDYLTALIVTIVAVIAIVIISRFLKPKD